MKEFWKDVGAVFIAALLLLVLAEAAVYAIVVDMENEEAKADDAKLLAAQVTPCPAE
jgi:hypothetical protein